MALGRISPGERGFEERTFECSTCKRTEKISVLVDPLKSTRWAGSPVNCSRRGDDHCGPWHQRIFIRACGSGRSTSLDVYAFDFLVE